MVPDQLMRRVPVYYGWVILAAGAVGLLMTSPGQTYAFSVFIEHFIADLHLSRSWVSTLYTLGTLAASALLPFVGQQVDRRGGRLVMSLVAVLLAAACAYMSLITSAWMLLLGIVAMRLLGQSSLTLVSQTVINQWWRRRRGLAMGLSGLGISLLGVGGFPILIQWLIDRDDWRAAYLWLALLVAVVLLPIAVFVVRDRPEKYGLVPDGDRPAADENAAAPAVEDNWTRPEALRTAAFWIIAAGGCAIAMFSTGLFFHMASILADNGFGPEIAAVVFVPTAISTAVFNLLGGLLSDRIAERYLLALALLMLTAALVLAPILNSLPLAYVYGALLGGLGGLYRGVSSVAWANYFGRLHLGAILGTATFILVVGTAIGPLPFGIARDLVGNYRGVLWLSALAPAALVVATLVWARKPGRPIMSDHA